jgi:hypothetical protein
LAKLKNKAPRRHLTGAASLQSGVVEFKFSRRHFKKIGEAGGKNSRKNMSREQASELARHANKVRWGKASATESAPTVR